MFYALCPFCSSQLKISPQQLNSRAGLVRCGHCEDVFNANEHLIPQAPQQSVTAATTPPQPIAASWEKRPAKSTKNTSYTFFCSLLLLLLAGQFVYFDNALILNNKALRPSIDQLSQRFNLNLPYYQNINEIHIIKRQVTVHPYIKAALEFNLIIKNSATVQQSYPDIRLSLTDNSTTLAQKTFTPQHYLPKDLINTAFAAQAEQPIELSFYEPSSSSNGFEIEFIGNTQPLIRIFR